MLTKEFEKIVNLRLALCRDTLTRKAEDRLHNFKVAAQMQDVTPVQALAGMMAKHTVSIYDMCTSGDAYPPEVWAEKIGDSINYLLLLDALVRETGMDGV